jgi:hypothetical protein
MCYYLNVHFQGQRVNITHFTSQRYPIACVKAQMGSRSVVLLLFNFSPSPRLVGWSTPRPGQNNFKCVRYIRGLGAIAIAEMSLAAIPITLLTQCSSAISRGLTEFIVI